MINSFTSSFQTNFVSAVHGSEIRYVTHVHSVKVLGCSDGQGGFSCLASPRPGLGTSRMSLKGDEFVVFFGKGVFSNKDLDRRPLRRRE